MPSTAIRTGRTALLLMDFQPAIVGMLDQPAVVEHARTALAWAREHEVQVAFVRVAFTPEDHAAIPDHHKAFARAKEAGLFADGDPVLEIDPALPVREGDIVVRKTRHGAFSTTDLHERLTASGIDTLVLSGISTSGVVLSTVRDAADRDYRLLVLADAVGDADPEVHRVLVEKVLPRQADVLHTAELAARTERG